MPNIVGVGGGRGSWVSPSPLSYKNTNISSSCHSLQQKSRREVPPPPHPPPLPPKGWGGGGQPNPKEDFNGCGVGDRKKKKNKEEEKKQEEREGGGGGRGNSSSSSSGGGNNNHNHTRQCTQPTQALRVAPTTRLSSFSLSQQQQQQPAPRATSPPLRDTSSLHGYQALPGARPYVRSTSASSPSIPSAVAKQQQQKLLQQHRYSVVNTTDNSNHHPHPQLPPLPPPPPPPSRTTTTTTTTNHRHHRHSTATLTSVGSGSAAMTTSLADWGGGGGGMEHGTNCGASGSNNGRVYIFLILGILLVMSGIIIGGFYLNIQQITTSSNLTEVLPTYVNALAVIIIGFSLMLLFWKRWRVFLFVVMVLNLGGFLLCLITGILTATHILKPITSISRCDSLEKSQVCLCHSPYRRVQLSLEHSNNYLFRLSFHGADSCPSIQHSLPSMLYVLVTINFISTLICVLAFIITYRVYRMKKRKDEDQWEEEICEHEERPYYTLPDYHHPVHCHDSYNQGPPSPGSPVPLLETVYPRGLSRVVKGAAWRDWLPDFARKDKMRHLKRSQSFSHRSRNNMIDSSSNEVFEDTGSGEVRTLDRGHSSSSSKTSHPPRRTLSESVRPSSAGNPDSARNSARLSRQDRRQRTMTMDNLDNRQLLLIMGLHMRNMQEQHEAEIQSMQEYHRRSKTPQPYNPGSKGGYMAGRRAYTPQPAKTQISSPGMVGTADGHIQLPRRRQLFADPDDNLLPPTSTAKTLAEAMFNDMVNPHCKFNPQEQIELETLPLCNVDGVADVDLLHVSKLKHNNSFHMTRAAATDEHSRINQSLLMDYHKRPSSIVRTHSASVPTKNDSVYVVPLYEKIDSPEHDIVTSPGYERMVSSPDTRPVMSHPDAMFSSATPTSYAIKVPSSECLYSKSTKSKESVYGKISKKSDVPERNSSAKRDSHQGSSKVSKETPTSGSRRSSSSQARTNKTPDSTKHYVCSPETHSKTPSRLEKSEQKDSGKKDLKRQDAVDLNVTVDSELSDLSQSQDNSNRGNISGASTELSPLNTNHNRSNASGNSMDPSPDGRPASPNPCNTPIPHPKMLPLTPDMSPTSPDDTSLSPELQSISHRYNASGNSSSLYMAEEHSDINLNKSVAALDYSRNISGASADISPEKIPSESLAYHSPKHAGYMVNTVPSVLNNSTTQSSHLSSFQNSPHSPSRKPYHSNQSPLYYINNYVSPDSSKQINRRCYDDDDDVDGDVDDDGQYDREIQAHPTSLMTRRGHVEETLGPREQPYGQNGPQSRNMEAGHVYSSPAKNCNVERKHKNRSHGYNNDSGATTTATTTTTTATPNNNNNNNSSSSSSRDHEYHHHHYQQQQQKMKPPPPPYHLSRSSSSSVTTHAIPHKLHAEVHKHPTRGKGNFRVGPEGISYRRKKVEGQDTSYMEEEEYPPRSQLDVEGHPSKDHYFDSHEESKHVASIHHYRNDLKKPHDIATLRDEANGSDSSALETVI
ncbi:uncharacterized protein LOC115218929 [Argonauta hians]